MNLLILLIKPVFSWKKQGKIINIDPGFLVEFIFPDKASFFPVLCYGSISQHLPVFIRCIHIKDKNAVRIQIIVHKFEYSKQIIFFCDVIHAVTDADNSTYCSVKFELSHILFQIKDLISGLCSLFHGFAQHFLRVVHTDHIITGLCQKLRHHSGSTSKFQHNTIFDPIFPESSDQIFCPFFIFNIVHEYIINSGKITVCLHKNLLQLKPANYLSAAFTL